jgi:hypothetical protein
MKKTVSTAVMMILMGLGTNAYADVDMTSTGKVCNQGYSYTLDEVFRAVSEQSGEDFKKQCENSLEVFGIRSQFLSVEIKKVGRCPYGIEFEYTVKGNCIVR